MIRNVGFIGLIILILIFVVQNTEVVEFRFLTWTLSLSRALMLLGTLAIGLIAGWLVTSSRYRKELKAKASRGKK